jgi:hypothetical protein
LSSEIVNKASAETIVRTSPSTLIIAVFFVVNSLTINSPYKSVINPVNKISLVSKSVSSAIELVTFPKVFILPSESISVLGVPPESANDANLVP